MAEDRFRRPADGDLRRRWDGDAQGWRFDGVSAGPAGLASVELPDGLEVDIDVAEPTRIVSVWVPDAEAMRAQNLVGAATSDRDALGRLALAEDVLDGAFEPTGLAVALASIDRALASRPLGRLFGSAEMAERVAAAMEAAHTNAGEFLESDIPEQIARALRDLDSQPGPDTGLDALIEALLDAGRELRHETDMEVLVAASAAGPPVASEVHRMRAHPIAAVGRLLDVVDLDALPQGLRPGQVAARATTASEIEIRVGVPVPTRPWWVRVHRHDTIVATAPILADGPDRGLARLLVPPADLHAIEVDIVNEPHERRPGRTARAVDGAVRQGRRAARAERAEQFAEADRGWRTCARNWEQARDKTRSMAALDRSRGSLLGSPPRLRGGPLLSDLADDWR